MNLDEIIAATGGGPAAYDHRPEGGSEITPLNPLGLDKTGAEPFPANVEAQQGAGSSGGGLTPGQVGAASDGTVQPGNNDGYSAQGGPEQLPTVSGLAALTAGGNFGANRPSGGAVAGGEPPGEADPRLGPSGDGQGPSHPVLAPQVKRL